MKKYKSIFLESIPEGYPDRATAENVAIEEMEKALNKVRLKASPVSPKELDDEMAVEIVPRERNSRDDNLKYELLVIQRPATADFDDDDEDPNLWDKVLIEPRRLRDAEEICKKIAQRRGFNFYWYSNRESVFYLKPISEPWNPELVNF
jgi:hypothetical protein